MFSIGNKFRLTVFGQSHSAAIGGVIEGIPAGTVLDEDAIARFMARRAPGQALTTPRRENDRPQILSGVADGRTCGAPLAFTIENTNIRSHDYERIRDVPRPMHSDYAAAIKFGGANDIRGGGQFSGRLTAPVCFAGAIAAQLLADRQVTIGAHISSIGSVEDSRFDPAGVCAADLRALSGMEFPALSDEAGRAFRKLIAEVRDAGDSVGGTVECAAVGVPAGIGDPMFSGIENLLARALFAIPAIKGVEFGAGFEAARLRGSDHNDPFEMAADGSVRTRTNRHGGILGGITTGMPLVFRVAIKPTPSIALEQDSVSLSERRNVRLAIEGRHDPCIVPRALPAVEAVTALVLADLIAIPAR